MSIEPPFTNNRAELMAAIHLLESVVARKTPVGQDDELHVVGDNQYVLNAATVWIPRWRANGWVTRKGSPVLNQDLLMRLDRVIERFRTDRRVLTFQWTRAHRAEPDNKWSNEWLEWNGNMRADTLAVQACGEGVVLSKEDKRTERSKVSDTRSEDDVIESKPKRKRVRKELA